MERFLESLVRGHIPLINSPIDTRPVTEEQAEAGKLQELLTMKYNISTLYKEASKMYDRNLKEAERNEE